MRLPPPSGRFPLPKLVKLINNSEKLYGDCPRLTTKTIAIRTDDSWANYGTVVRLTEGEGESPKDEGVVDLGKEVRLISSAVDAKSIQSTDDLRRQMARWREVTGVEHGFHFRDGVRVSRKASRNDWTGVTPCWVFEPAEDVDNRVNVNSPDGPFLNPNEEIFADELPTLAMRWLECPALSGQRQVRNEYYFVAADPRPHLEELEAADQELTIRVTETGNQSLYCGAVFTNLQGDQYERWAPVDDSSGEAQIQFVGSVKELDLYLMLEDGEWLDRYHETERFQSWDRSLFNEPREEIDPEYADLVSALEKGESESVEFKEWIKAAKRDKKSRELLESAVAFSNARGGYIYIGVDDHGEPVNIIPELEKAYGDRTGGDREAMQDAYAADLRRMLSEGVAPQIRPEFDWIERAKLPILRITIPPGAGDARYVVIETRTAYIRVGATDRKTGDTRWADMRPMPSNPPFEQGPGLSGRI